LRANASKESGDLEATIVIYNLAIADDPENCSMRTGKYYSNQAAAYRLTDDYQSARKVYRHAIDHDPDWSAYYWNEMAETYAAEGELSEAINTYLDALKNLDKEQRSEIRRRWRDLAESLHHDGECKNAKMLLEAAVERDCKDSGYLDRLGKEGICVADWDTAITAYKTLIEADHCLTEEDLMIQQLFLDPYYWSLGVAYLGAGKLSEAENCFSRKGGTHELVEIYVRQGQWDAAKAQCCRDLKAVPTEFPERIGEALFDLGWLLEQEGERDASSHCYLEAAQYFMEALKSEGSVDGKLWPSLDLTNYTWSLALTFEKIGAQLTCGTAVRICHDMRRGPR
jgi:tetratricopeptide (TPR) repeat protein